jgi:hypothetical protein
MSELPGPRTSDSVIARLPHCLRALAPARRIGQPAETTDGRVILVARFDGNVDALISAYDKAHDVIMSRGGAVPIGPGFLGQTGIMVFARLASRAGMEPACQRFAPESSAWASSWRDRRCQRAPRARA